MDTFPAKVDLAFVHLSDLHFRRGSVGDAHDQDAQLRNELELDLRRLRPRLPRLDGLIVSGDIAFAGKPEEYLYASSWFKRICELLGCDSANVMLTPGNHDVDRALIPLDGAVDSLQKEIREAGSVVQCSERLAAIFISN